MHEITTFVLVTLPNIQQLKKFTHRLINKPFLIWLLTTPLHLKYVATLPCNLSIVACFADINVLHGSVATYTRNGGILNTHLTTNLQGNLLVKFFNRLRFDRIMVTSLWPTFFARVWCLVFFTHSVYCMLQSSYCYRLYFIIKHLITNCNLTLKNASAVSHPSIYKVYFR